MWQAFASSVADKDAREGDRGLRRVGGEVPKEKSLRTCCKWKAILHVEVFHESGPISLPYLGGETVGKRLSRPATCWLFGSEVDTWVLCAKPKVGNGWALSLRTSIIISSKSRPTVVVETGACCRKSHVLYWKMSS